jgi:hypothetical protein
MVSPSRERRISDFPYQGRIVSYLPLKEREIVTFLPLQGGGQEGDGGLSK